MVPFEHVHRGATLVYGAAVLRRTPRRGGPPIRVAGAVPDRASRRIRIEFGGALPPHAARDGSVLPIRFGARSRKIRDSQSRPGRREGVPADFGLAPVTRSTPRGSRDPCSADIEDPDAFAALPYRVVARSGDAHSVRICQGARQRASLCTNSAERPPTPPLAPQYKVAPPLCIGARLGVAAGFRRVVVRSETRIRAARLRRAYHRGRVLCQLFWGPLWYSSSEILGTFVVLQL